MGFNQSANRDYVPSMGVREVSSFSKFPPLQHSFVFPARSTRAENKGQSIGGGRGTSGRETHGKTIGLFDYFGTRVGTKEEGSSSYSRASL